jgi:hypothetical protein
MTIRTTPDLVVVSADVSTVSQEIIEARRPLIRAGWKLEHLVGRSPEELQNLLEEQEVAQAA